ncbi:GNAT family N-acetyltransferase [Agromyces ramosus]|uniref:RimJ/RimL family protein N-acetyltransferase n=1 Tax=Agromyces ramosus TaxID=33879 RepID=A0ABU0R3X2_9MICO|nr:GNAT family N-acetyltransferase [Agromyces ramosus]MDQ0892769.1 RimJ/RimL family protein N-acetyltransferase [Agromyces ramosus]
MHATSVVGQTSEWTARAGLRLEQLLRHLPVHRPRWLRGPALSDPVRRPTIVTERLTLRAHRLRHRRAWYALQSDPDVVRYLQWPLRSRTASFKHLLDRMRHTRLERKDDFLALAVLLDGRVIGDVSLHLRNVDPHLRHLEIGWVFAPAAQGRGYATEAAIGMLELAFGRLGARQVTARMQSANDRSQALATRLGFVEVSEARGIRLMAISSEQFALTRRAAASRRAE